MNELGEFLKDLRNLKSKSIRGASEEIGISHTYLDSLEKGYDPRTKKERKPTPDVLRKISNYYNVPYVELMTLAGYTDEQGAVPVDSFFDAFNIRPSDMKSMKKNGVIFVDGSDGFKKIKTTNEDINNPDSDTSNKKSVEKNNLLEMDIDVYSLLKNKSDLYYKSKLLKEDDKDFLINLLNRTFNKDID